MLWSSLAFLLFGLVIRGAQAGLAKERGGAANAIDRMKPVEAAIDEECTAKELKNHFAEVAKPDSVLPLGGRSAVTDMDVATGQPAVTDIDIQPAPGAGKKQKANFEALDLSRTIGKDDVADDTAVAATELHQFAYSNDVDGIKKYLEQFGTYGKLTDTDKIVKDTEYPSMFTPLHTAVNTHSKEAIEAILQAYPQDLRGTLVKAGDKDDFTALHVLANMADPDDLRVAKAFPENLSPKDWKDLVNQRTGESLDFNGGKVAYKRTAEMICIEQVTAYHKEANQDLCNFLGKDK